MLMYNIVLDNAFETIFHRWQCVPASGSPLLEDNGSLSFLAQCSRLEPHDELWPLSCEQEP